MKISESCSVFHVDPLHDGVKIKKHHPSFRTHLHLCRLDPGRRAGQRCKTPSRNQFRPRSWLTRQAANRQDVLNNPLRPVPRPLPLTSSLLRPLARPPPRMEGNSGRPTGGCRAPRNSFVSPSICCHCFCQALPWTAEDDRRLVDLVNQHGGKEWREIASGMDGRKPRQCRERFWNHLRKGIKKGPWSPEEDAAIVEVSC